MAAPDSPRKMNGETEDISKMAGSLDREIGVDDLVADPYILPETKEPFPSGGLIFTNHLQLKAHRKILWSFAKGIGMHLFNAKDLMNTSLPVKLFEPRSFLQRVADPLVYAPLMLGNAANATDPVERMKWVASFVLAGLNRTASQWKPFNPILGETWQAYYPDGTVYEAEQTSHHPPISHFILSHPTGLWRMHGYGTWSGEFRGNYIRGQQKGPCTVEMADGSKISWEQPYLDIRGVLWGDRVLEYKGATKIVDDKSGLVCELKFDPDSAGFFGGFFKRKKSPSDTLVGEIYRMPEGKSGKKHKEVLSTASGSWISSISWDNVKYWDKATEQVVAPTGVTEPLPSDCRFREDLVNLEQRDFDKAQEWKIALEDKQRADRKLRQSAAAAVAKAKKRLSYRGESRASFGPEGMEPMSPSITGAQTNRTSAAASMSSPSVPSSSVVASAST